MKNRLVSWVGITGLVIAAGLSAGCRDMNAPEPTAEIPAEQPAMQPAAQSERTGAPAPYEYDAERNQYWHPGHGHWHPGRPPER